MYNMEGDLLDQWVANRADETHTVAVIHNCNGIIWRVDNQPNLPAPQFNAKLCECEPYVTRERSEASLAHFGADVKFGAKRNGAKLTEGG